MKLQTDRLTLFQIATEWAKEVADEPGSLSRDEIFMTFVRSIFRGEFEDDTLSLEKEPEGGAVRIDGRYTDAKHEPTKQSRRQFWTRDMLLRAMRPPPGVGADFRQRWSWERLASDLELDDFDSHFRRAYLEELSITHAAFGAWCDRQGHERPTFWFPQASKGSRGRKTATRTRQTEIMTKIADMVRTGEIHDERGAPVKWAKSLAGNFHEYRPDTIRKYISDALKERRQRERKPETG